MNCTEVWIFLASRFSAILGVVTEGEKKRSGGQCSYRRIYILHPSLKMCQQGRLVLIIGTEILRLQKSVITATGMTTICILDSGAKHKRNYTQFTAQQMALV